MNPSTYLSPKFSKFPPVSSPSQRSPHIAYISISGAWNLCILIFVTEVLVHLVNKEVKTIFACIQFITTHLESESGQLASQHQPNGLDNFSDNNIHCWLHGLPVKLTSA